MSKFNFTKTVLATALAVALVPSTASAAKIVLGAHTKHAFEVTDTTNVTADLNATFSYDLEGGDILVGRTTGSVTVRITLTGADFSQNPTVVVPTTQKTGGAGADPTVSFTGNVASFVIAAKTDGSGYVTGPLFTITAPSLKTTKVKASSTLTTLAGKVEASVDVRDTTSGTTLQSAVNGSILTASQASKITIAATTDVTANVASGKKEFTIAAGKATDARTAQLASITTVSQGDKANATSLVSAAGSGIAENISTAGSLDFIFDTIGGASATPANRDRLGVQVNFADIAGFTHVFLSSAATCPTSGTTPSDAGGSTAVLVKTGNQYAGEIDLTSDDTQVLLVCGRTDGTTAIARQDITVSARYNFLNARDTAFSTAVKTVGIIFDGSEQKVDFFNPSTNVNQQSFLRISNASTTNGRVTIDGRCDDGTAVTQGLLNLDAQKSVLLTAQALAAGTGMTTALGTCSAGGKLRLVVTGEFTPMKVQNFVKSVTASGEVTTNFNDEK